MASSSRTRRLSVRSLLYSQRAAPYLFVAPFVVVFVVFYGYPFIEAVLLSFQSVSPTSAEFIGIENYQRLANSEFRTAIVNTAIYTLGIIIVLVPLPLLIATLLNAKVTPLRGFFKASLFVPALTSVIVAGVIFRLMFGETESSMANQILGVFDIEPIAWRSERWSGMLLMIALTGWKFVGVNVLYFLAGLQSIPRSLYEAAEVDGAGALRKFWNITLPLLRPISVYVTTITIFAGFRMFEESYVFWQTQSPANIGLTVVQYIYKVGLQQGDLGFGSAAGVVLLAIVFVSAMAYLGLAGEFRREKR